MTDAMPTIAARNRHKIHGKDGKFAPRPAAYVQHLSDDAFPDSAIQEAARIQRAMSTDMPPMPEPIERETWRDVWADVRGVVLCAGFVAVVLAFGAHVVGLWGA